MFTDRFAKHAVHFIAQVSIKALDIVRPTKETWGTRENIPLLSQQIVGCSFVVNFYSVLILYQLVFIFFCLVCL